MYNNKKDEVIIHFIKYFTINNDLQEAQIIKNKLINIKKIIEDEGIKYWFLLSLDYFVFIKIRKLLNKRGCKLAYIGNDLKRVAYLEIAKVACTSLKFCLGVCMPPLHYHISYKSFIKKYTISRNKYFLFTFVRNPFERLVSCYVDKFILLQHNSFFWFEGYLFGYLDNVECFEDFVKKIFKIPRFLKDRHILDQYSIVYTRFGKCRVDYIGKFENLKKDFEPIRKKYSLKDLPHFNSSKEDKDYFWMDFYTKETAKIVYKMYKKDVIKFGYEGAYKELLDYLDKKDNN